MSANEGRKRVAHLAAKYGYEISITRGQHLRLTKDGYPIVHTSYSTSDRRSTKNLEARLRKAQPR